MLVAAVVVVRRVHDCLMRLCGEALDWWDDDGSMRWTFICPGVDITLGFEHAGHTQI